MLQHPLPERNNESGFLGEGNEFGRQDESYAGLAPAEERFRTYNLVSCESRGLRALPLPWFSWASVVPLGTGSTMDASVVKRAPRPFSDATRNRRS